jgi:hypothetical protein
LAAFLRDNFGTWGLHGGTLELRPLALLEQQARPLYFPSVFDSAAILVTFFPLHMLHFLRLLFFFFAFLSEPTLGTVGFLPLMEGFFSGALFSPLELRLDPIEMRADMLGFNGFLSWCSSSSL